MTSIQNATTSYLFLLLLFACGGNQLSNYPVDIDSSNADEYANAIIYQTSNQFLIHQPQSHDLILIQLVEGVLPDKLVIKKLQKGAVTLYDKTLQQELTVRPGDDVIGVSILRNKRAVRQFLRAMESATSPDDEVLQQIIGASCNCISDDLASEACDSGGPGAESCTVADNVIDETPTLDINFTNGCTVVCRKDYYACCPTN